MASVSIASFANGLVQAQITYDDVTLAISQMRIVNDSDFACTMEVRRSGNLIRDLTVGAHASLSRNLPKGVAFTLDALSEMTMGDLVIGARFG